MVNEGELNLQCCGKDRKLNHEFFSFFLGQHLEQCLEEGRQSDSVLDLIRYKCVWHRWDSKWTIRAAKKWNS
jgi:hypothetical protein